MDRMKRMQDPRIVVFLHQCPHGEESVQVTVRKGWWGGPGQGGMGRELHRFCIPADGLGELERIARGLEAAAAAIRG